MVRRLKADVLEQLPPKRRQQASSKLLSVPDTHPRVSIVSCMSEAVQVCRHDSLIHLKAELTGKGWVHVVTVWVQPQ